MIETNEKEQKYVSIGKAAEYLGVSKDTLRRWEKMGKIVCHRTPGDRRRYFKEDLDKILEGGVTRSYEKSIEPTTPVSSEFRAPPFGYAQNGAIRDFGTITPPHPQEPSARLARDKTETKPSFLEKSKETLKKVFKSREDKKVPTHYISTPAGPRRINIRKPKLSISTNKFKLINIHTLIFISVLITTAIVTILVFYMLFQGEVPKIEVPKVEIPKTQERVGEKILSPIP